MVVKSYYKIFFILVDLQGKKSDLGWGDEKKNNWSFSELFFLFSFNTVKLVR